MGLYMATRSTSPRKRFEALDDQARARWLDPAEAEFCEHGFEQASLNRIVARAGESKGRTYHYFADKGELFRATLERRLDRCDVTGPVGAAGPASDADQFWRDLGTFCDRLTRTLQIDDRLAALIRTLHREAAAQQAFAIPLGALRAKIDDLLVAGQAIGAIRDDLPTALLTDIAMNLMATIDRWFALNGGALSDEAEAALSQRAFSLLMAPLLPRHDPDGGFP